MENLRDWIVDKVILLVGLVVLAGLIELLFTHPFLFITSVVAIGIAVFLGVVTIIHFSDRKFKKEYKDFLHRVNGSRFFFYNSRRNSVDFAKEAVVPHLESTTKVVFVDGEDIDCGPDSKFVSHMLYGVKERKGFPYLIKVVNEEPVDYSVNNLFYNTMTGKKPLTPLLQRINAFYEAPAISE